MMNAATEKRLLQGTVALACLVPLIAGATGVLRGVGWLDHRPPAVDLDSHFRYMSGIFFGVGIAFTSCIPAIETKGTRLRMLVGFVVLGGVARLLSLAEIGVPGRGHQFGLVMELCVTPLLAMWQAGFARRYRMGSSAALTEG
jgi:Domain of unknown function (DUF4345)